MKEINSGISLEGMMLKLKLQDFGHLMRSVDSLEKTDAGRDWGQEKKGTTEDEMAGWHHWLDGRESEWTPGVGDGQGGLVCCDSWGPKELDTTDRLNWTELIRQDTIKVLDENTGKTFSDINCTTVFLGWSLKAIEIKGKINKWSLVKLNIEKKIIKKKWKDNLWNGRKYLQLMWLTKS